jgi:hypothetical protein
LNKGLNATFQVSSILIGWAMPYHSHHMLTFQEIPVAQPDCSTLRASKLHELFNDRSFAGLLIRELDMVDERHSTLRIG